MSRFFRLYEIAYDGVNDRAIWGKVIFEIMHEVTSPGRLWSPLPKGFQFTPETQAIWRLVERKITPTPGVITFPGQQVLNMGSLFASFS
jgi:hypothetical protein